MVKKSNLESSQKVIFYSFPVVGLCMTGDNLKYFYTILLPLLEENFEKLSKTQKMPYLYQKVDNKKSEDTFQRHPNCSKWSKT